MEADLMIDELGLLSKKFKEKKKLNNEDNQKVYTLLTVVLKDPSLYNSAIDLMTSLPLSNVKAFAEIWRCSDLSTKDKMIEALLGSKSLGTSAGYNRRIEMIRIFTHSSKEAATQLLADIVEKVTSAGMRRPNNQILKVFRKTLMDNGVLFNIDLRSSTMTHRAMSGLATMVLFSLGEAQVGEPCIKTDIKSRFLTWLGTSVARMTIASHLVKELEMYTSGWSEELQRECMKLGVIKTITLTPEETSCVPSIDSRIEQEKTKGNQDLGSIDGQKQGLILVEQKGQGVINEDVVSQGLSHRLNTNEDTDPKQLQRKSIVKRENIKQEAQFDISKHLRLIGNHVTDLEEENRNLRVKLLNAISKSDSLTRRVSDQDERIKSLGDNAHKLGREVQDFSDKVRIGSNKVTELEKTLVSEKQLNVKKLQDLIDQTEQECESVKEQFINNLAYSLGMVYINFMDMKEASMTIELGEHLRYSITKILSILETKGIKFE